MAPEEGEAGEGFIIAQKGWCEDLLIFLRVSKAALSSEHHATRGKY